MTTIEMELIVAKDQLQEAADRHWRDVQEIFKLTESDFPYVDVAVDNENFEPFIVRWYGPYGEQIREDLELDLAGNHPFNDLEAGTYRCGIGREDEDLGDFGAIVHRGGWYFDQEDMSPLDKPPVDTTETSSLPAHPPALDSSAEEQGS